MLNYKLQMEGSFSKRGAWRVGEVFPENVVQNLPAIAHVTVSADGDELGYLRAQFTNIPMAQKRLIVWRGEFARFILENL